MHIGLMLVNLTWSLDHQQEQIVANITQLEQGLLAGRSYVGFETG